MKCPFCAEDSTKVVDSRDISDGRTIRRRRECEKCARRFTTYEELESLKITVLKRDGRRQEFSREKLQSGLERAFEKRPLAEENIERILSEVEYELHSKHIKEVGSRDIGKLVLRKIKETDEVAYLRFASVYKGFGSATSFQKEIEKL
jgi:transcriptional repressor NrdR